MPVKANLIMEITQAPQETQMVPMTASPDTTTALLSMARPYTDIAKPSSTRTNAEAVINFQSNRDIMKYLILIPRSGAFLPKY